MNTTIHAAVAGAIEPLGGFLRCETCGHEKPIGNVSPYLANGWPKHCGYTMRWWTQRQIDAGQVTPLRAVKAAEEASK